MSGQHHPGQVPKDVIPPHLRARVRVCARSLADKLGYTIMTVRGEQAFYEAVCHGSLEEVPEGNLKLARLGESALTTDGIERLYIAGHATGAEVSAMETSRFTIRNLSLISRDLGLEECIIVGGSKPSVSDKMRAQILQASLGAVYTDGGMDALSDIAQRLGL